MGNGSKLKTKTLQSCISEDMKNLVNDVAKELGLTPSEYVRMLVLVDLQKRGYLTSSFTTEE